MGIVISHRRVKKPPTITSQHVKNVETGNLIETSIKSGMIRHNAAEVFIDKVLSTVYFRPNFFKGTKFYAEVPKYFNKHP